MTRKLVLVGGGSRSGKSDFALALGRSLGDHRLFVATAEACDNEMRERIGRHRSTRRNDFRTIEEPTALVDLLREVQEHDVVVIDCITIWVANLLLQGKEPDVVLQHVDDLTEILGRRRAHTVLVSSEVGLGLVPETALGRVFRDVAGAAHQRLAVLADEVYFGVMGVMLRLKPGPVTMIQSEEFNRREREGRREMERGDER